tara:strand:+ start:1661 stop:2239 length:579 start_codon:yes stop_codon:yes gene_type:complete
LVSAFSVEKDYIFLEEYTIAKQDKRSRLNEDITASEVRLIRADGEQVGIVGIEEAMRTAGDASLDLVEIVPNAEPPVCRVMDYGKYIFESKKQKQGQRKKQKQVHVKEIKFRPGTEIADFNVKLKSIRKFLENGDKCKVTMRFRGREHVHRELGLEVLERVESDLADISLVEQRPIMEGKQMIMVLVPAKKK